MQPRRLTVSCALLAGALVTLAAPASAQDAPPPESASAPVVVEVTGDDVNLRVGPSIDHHDVGQVSRGHLLVETGRDGDFVRVRVPGGVPVYVFGSLLVWDGPTEGDGPAEGDGEGASEGALRCTVDADDVLMRATPTTAHYPVHDQKLQRGTELVVLGVQETEKGRWLHVVTPPDIHVWIHGSYVRPVDPPPPSHVLRSRAEARLDELTGGRTKVERERTAAARAADFEERLGALTAKADAGAHDAELEAAARALADETDDEALRVRALALAERVVGLREAAIEKLRAEAAAARKAAEEAQERRRELEEERRRRDAEQQRRDGERERRKAGRGAPEATGIVRVLGDAVLLEVDDEFVADLGSRKFRLADYDNRRVRIWGTRRKRDGLRDRIDVTSLEIVTDDDAPR